MNKIFSKITINLCCITILVISISWSVNADEALVIDSDLSFHIVTICQIC